MKRLVNRLSGACLYVLLALIVGMSSCEDDANDWTVNKNYDALFRPLTFDKSATDATSVTLRYSQIVNAKVYIFEFYTDSLEFNAENYVRTDTILKDTLTVFSESNTPMRVEYRTLFQEFNGSTQYSVRMKGEAVLILEGISLSITKFMKNTPYTASNWKFQTPLFACCVMALER